MHLNNWSCEGSIIGADCSTPCIGSFFVDKFWQMPPLEELTPKKLLDECHEREIRAIIPSRDGELAFFAKNRDLFIKNGIALMVSPASAVEICFDKVRFWDFCRKYRLPGIPTSTEIEEIEANSYVVKEQFGAGSHQIGINLTKSKAKAWAKNLNNPIFQPYIQGKEYSVDLYRNLKTVQGTVARSRDYVVRGESQITSSAKEPALEQLSSKLADKLKLYGHSVIQLFKNEAGQCSLIECNPRFGGASSLSIAMGLNSFVWFFQECLGQPLPPFVRSIEEKQQVRYPNDLILHLTPSEL